VGLLRRTYCLNEQNRKYVSSYLNNDDNLIPELKFRAPSGHAMFNGMQWIILATFESGITNIAVHELGDPQHSLSLFCGRHIHITRGITEVHLSKKFVTSGGLCNSLHIHRSDQIRQAAK